MSGELDRNSDPQLQALAPHLEGATWTDVWAQWPLGGAELTSCCKATWQNQSCSWGDSPPPQKGLTPLGSHSAGGRSRSSSSSPCTHVDSLDPRVRLSHSPASGPDSPFSLSLSEVARLIVRGHAEFGRPSFWPGRLFTITTAFSCQVRVSKSESFLSPDIRRGGRATRHPGACLPDTSSGDGQSHTYTHTHIIQGWVTQARLVLSTRGKPCRLFQKAGQQRQHTHRLRSGKPGGSRTSALWTRLSTGTKWLPEIRTAP